MFIESLLALGVLTGVGDISAISRSYFFLEYGADCLPILHSVGNSEFSGGYLFDCLVQVMSTVP